MTTLKTKLALVAASTLALAAISRADTPAAPPAVTIGGFGVFEWDHISGAQDDKFDINSAYLTATGTYGAVTGVVGLYYVPGTAVFTPNSTDADLHVLDINATWTLGSGWSIQGGRFLSWMGYESFFTINNPEITGANSNPLWVSGYEDGVRAVYTESSWNAGIAVVDSAFKSPSAFAGDGELKSNYGGEAYIDTSFGIKDLDVWFGVAHDSSGDVPRTVAATSKGITTFDLHSQYQLTPDMYVAGEYTIEDNVITNAAGVPVDSETWLVLVDYTFSSFSKSLSAAFRVSGDTYNGVQGGGRNDFRYTFAPTYAVNDHFSVRAEITYQVDNAGADLNGPGFAPNSSDATFLGGELVFKF
jgi:hypothetical protein